MGYLNDKIKSLSFDSENQLLETTQKHFGAVSFKKIQQKQSNNFQIDETGHFLHFNKLLSFTHVIIYNKKI